MGNNGNSYAEIPGFTACLREKDKTTWDFFLWQHKIKKFKSCSSHIHLLPAMSSCCFILHWFLQWFNQLLWNNGQQNQNYALAFGWVSKLNCYAAWAEEWQRWSNMSWGMTEAEQSRKLRYWKWEKEKEEQWGKMKIKTRHITYLLNVLF